MAADTPGCDVRFKSPTLEVLRRCTSTRQRPLVSTCNTTGLWTYYDDKVERACASFTSPVKRRYKNVFCYMCNTGYRPLVVLQDDLSTGFDANIVGRVSFYALLNFDDSDDDDAPLVAMSGGLSESGVTADVASPGDCEEGTVFDPLHVRHHPSSFSCFNFHVLNVCGIHTVLAFCRSRHWPVQLNTLFRIPRQNHIHVWIPIQVQPPKKKCVLIQCSWECFTLERPLKITSLWWWWWWWWWWWLFIILPVDLLVYLSTDLSICLSNHPFIHLSVHVWCAVWLPTCPVWISVTSPREQLHRGFLCQQLLWSHGVLPCTGHGSSTHPRHFVIRHPGAQPGALYTQVFSTCFVACSTQLNDILRGFVFVW